MAAIEVENLGDEAMPGSITADARWLAIDPARLDPTAKRQIISIQADPGDIPAEARSVTVTVRTDDGQQEDVIFSLQRGLPARLVASMAVGAVLTLAAAVGFLLMR